MGVLLLLTLWIFLAESTVIFKRIPLFKFNNMKRLITVGVAAVLWFVVLLMTILYKGHELVWFIWIVISLSITGFQLLFITTHVFLERGMKKRFTHNSLMKKIVLGIEQ